MSKKDNKKDKPNPNSPFAALAPLREKLAAAEQKPKQATPRENAKALRSTPEEEELAFVRMMTGVVPIGGDHKRASPVKLDAARTEKAVVHQQREEEEVRERLRVLVSGDSRFEVSDDGHRVEGRRVDTPQETLRKLRRGLFPIDARLDLHGMREGEARAAVTTFLTTERSRGERCVLIIHGKGGHSLGGAAILRGEIGAWLSQGSASAHVDAFATAAPDDGGEGATYVLIRR